MSNQTSVRGALSVPMNAAKGSESMEDPKPRPLRFFPTLASNETRSCTADSMRCASVCLLWNTPCLIELTALMKMRGLQPAIGTGSTTDMQINWCTMQLHAGSAANGSYCLQHGSNSIHNIATARVAVKSISIHARSICDQSFECKGCASVKMLHEYTSCMSSV